MSPLSHTKSTAKRPNQRRFESAWSDTVPNTTTKAYDKHNCVSYCFRHFPATMRQYLSPWEVHLVQQELKAFAPTSLPTLYSQVLYAARLTISQFIGNKEADKVAFQSTFPPSTTASSATSAECP